MKNRAVVGGLAAVVVVGLVVAGLFAIGSPATARKYKADQERRNRISQLHYILSSHVRSQGSLPTSLDDVDPEAFVRSGYSSDLRKDPETGEYFDYRRTAERRYEICADFLTSSKDRRAEEYGSYPGDIEHNPGRNCYQRTISEQDVDAATDFQDGESFPVRPPAEEKPVRPQPVTPSGASASPVAAVQDY